MISFAYLGPLEIQVHGRAERIPGRKQRQLLATLLIRNGQIVSIGEISEELWPEEPPKGAENAIQAHVSRLRRMLYDRSGSHFPLLTRDPGYQLDVPPDRVDAARFQELCNQARQRRGEGASPVLALYREALGLWRGPALQDVPCGPIRDAEAARLNRMKTLVATRVIEINLDEGYRPEEIIPVLEELISRNPLHERLYGQLMVALDRAGHPKEALEIYQELRREWRTNSAFRHRRHSSGGCIRFWGERMTNERRTD
ncbi:AfsR/SARP family transcriptional regulator [Actinomadura sp. KC216]|uniref:AfsR/SARP family transcriptional regulator n=1 Tax=Actinomadura sp. KC216 TaxID=2530370 RepID=UPI0014044C09|nr:AfsR/SARP family transcriptional regulator [Actinomadura sp. KC216]